VWFAYSPDRKGEHPQSHLSNFIGTLQADGYAGFDQIYEVGRIQEAACWAHVRRKFYDLEMAHKSPVASEALERIAERTSFLRAPTVVEKVPRRFTVCSVPPS
jgi:transposase